MGFAKTSGGAVWARASIALAAAVVPIVAVSVAPAAAAPGSSITTHFSSVQSWETPAGSPTNNTNCTGPVGNALINDFAFVDANGQGVQHLNVNGAQDGWFTTTFTGTGTVSFYDPSRLDVSLDGQGNITGVDILDDNPADLVVTGHLTDWFGFEGNKQNAVGHGTVNFQGVTVGGDISMPVSFHGDTHFAWLPGMDPSGPPSFSFNKVSC